ncbi:hypothetical protein J1N35_001496 [Gossypium stocksii]|uniref:Uncharacterized protein n=1 Tax=Gossypium stocksii TaxID=47602 RepID=A0A9D3WK18_9ROSI|nr:hypothetical protein J1N35_001496 [Gossypium stocksii]
MQARVGASQNGRLKASKLYSQTVCARRNRIVMNKETRQNVFEGKLSTKVVKEEKTPFMNKSNGQIFGTKDWDSQVCKSNLVENEAKVENEVLEQGQLETKHFGNAKFKKLFVFVAWSPRRF